jgi:endonuclease YncB( thermonuclease family)
MARKEKVTRIIDGDTFMTSSRKRPVRLANYDAPERGQQGYKGSKEALRTMISGETVTIDVKAHDVYGRAVANVKVGRRSVNNAMKNKRKSKSNL